MKDINTKYLACFCSYAYGVVVNDITDSAGGLRFDSRLVKSDTVSPTASHRCDVSTELCFPGAQPTRWASLHASASYRGNDREEKKQTYNCSQTILADTTTSLAPFPLIFMFITDFD